MGILMAIALVSRLIRDVVALFSASISRNGVFEKKLIIEVFETQIFCEKPEIELEIKRATKANFKKFIGKKIKYQH